MSKQRRRLDADAAREVILDAAEKRLVVVGPSGIRLQEVAADAGLSHPTVLHHFGSRELLVKAVIARALGGLREMLLAAIAASNGDEEALEAMLEDVADALERRGHGRVLTWLSLEGHRLDPEALRLNDIIEAMHAMRVKRCGRARRPKREDTARTVVLAALALIGGSVMGPALLENAGLGTGPRAGARARAWLARLLIRHLDGPGE